MGEVFLAEDTKLDRKVAIKMLPARSIGDDHAKNRLIREAKAAATLDHSNICSIYEVGEEGDCTFIVMQYIEGGSLAAKIKDNPLPSKEVIDIGIQATDALAEAHARGVIHRDIKPQNVMITSRGQVKILDFGLAKFQRDGPAVDSQAATEARLTDAGAIVGTPGYMSPEQLKGQPIDTRTDLFSLGVMLYECATGQYAFSGSNPVAIALQVANVDPPRPSQLNASIPWALERIIVKAMAKEADARYASASAMHADLLQVRAELQETRSNDTQPMALQLPSSLWRKVPAQLFGWLRQTSLAVKGALVLLFLLVILGVLSATSIFTRSPHQPVQEAMRWYDRGTGGIREGAYYQASKALERAVEVDNKFPLAHARLAEAYAEIDSIEKAREELLRALSLVPDRSRLSSLDGLRLDAIAAMVTRDFASAIQNYTKIADQLPSTEKASAYVDLGRSYEKNENIDKALEYYRQATKADEQSAAAFLRSGILYGRRQELVKATDAFDRAEKIYQAMSSQEGIAEVLYQRGAVLARIRNLADARTQLERSLEVSRNVPNEFQAVRAQIQLSAVYFAEGDSERAKKIATEAVGIAQRSNIRSLAANGLIDLGYTLLSRGEFAEARSYFKQALDLAQVDNAKRIEARAKLALGSLNVQEGNLDEATSFLEAALKFFQPAGYQKDTSNALVLLGRAHQQKGEYEVALKIFEQQLGVATRLGDPAIVAASHFSIGDLLGIEQERYPEALSHLDESLKINEALGAKVGMGWDQMNRGTLFWLLGRYQEARSALDQAYSIANQPEASFKSQFAWVELTRAQMALSERRLAEAKAKGQTTLDLAGTKYMDVALQAKHTIGFAQALSGSPQSARKLCEEAVANAKKESSPRLLSTALLTLAEVLLLANDAPSALATASQAQGMFAAAGQQDSQWRALLVAARASQITGDNSGSKDFATRADSVRAGLRNRWGAEAYDTYSRRPDIQNSLKQLTQLLTH